MSKEGQNVKISATGTDVPESFFEKMERIRQPTANPWSETDTVCYLKKTAIGWVSFGNTEMNYRKYVDSSGWVPMTMEDISKIWNEMPKVKKSLIQRFIDWVCDKITSREVSK